MEDFITSAIDWISQPWPWWVGGPMIAGIMFVLLYFGKEFGISANFRIMCAAEGAGSFADFFQFDWKSQSWNLMVALGAMFGGYLAAQYFSGSEGMYAHVSDAAEARFVDMGLIQQGERVGMVPNFYSWSSLLTLKGILIIVGGGFLVGFGARYAGGCTSGHAISGMSALQLPSLIAVVGFFLGGLFMTHLLFPFIF